MKVVARDRSKYRLKFSGFNLKSIYNFLMIFLAIMAIDVIFQILILGFPKNGETFKGIGMKKPITLTDKIPTESENP